MVRVCPILCQIYPDSLPELTLWQLYVWHQYDSVRLLFELTYTIINLIRLSPQPSISSTRKFFILTNRTHEWFEHYENQTYCLHIAYFVVIDTDIACKLDKEWIWMHIEWMYWTEWRRRLHGSGDTDNRKYRSRAEISKAAGYILLKNTKPHMFIQRTFLTAKIYVPKECLRSCSTT